MSLILAAAEVDIVTALSVDRSRFIDILRRKPHLPVLVLGPAMASGGHSTAALPLEPADEGVSFAEDDPGVAKMPSDSARTVRKGAECAVCLSNKLPADFILFMRG